ncbi:Glycoside hydrolase superfamily [Penicillium vulpinum]|uniref:1,3-beta-glucanosyltransferase n=1 Tax=Penicillium vulpinum TaxID=29845 RepID=A0A1V6RFK7_9EURO|nr:Glycoside hydrolase superfamily [Penicillium vulpinum]KAJ5958070.1 Glycoside hydrolase superfamily [Penicillium vulpinum]OQE00304.1 hypothetical protein PENVUL_c054G05821 [Penicillium vulpinum]
MSLPIISVAGNGLLRVGHRFQIKGVVYVEKASGSTPIDVLADSRASQCAVDAPIIKALGANTINVFYTDATQSHDKCMQIFQDNGIYVMTNMAIQKDSTLLDLTGMDASSNIANSTWQMDVFKQYAAILDSMAGYSNLLALLVGNNIITGASITDKGPTVDLAPYLKAAARDMKAYAAARQYRPIPIGYATDSDYTYIQALGEYLVCGGKSDEAIDFYSVNQYSWCGKSSIITSGYDGLTSKLEGLGVPMFFSEDGCNSPAPRLFEDQSAVFGSNMSSVWSGAIIYEWRQEESKYGLVSYTTSGVSTPTTLADYNVLKSQWANVTANTHPPSTFSTPSCPTSINSYWPINPSAALPTIAGLDFATIKPASATSTSDDTSTSISITGTSTSASNTTEPKHSIGGGAIAGISVGVTSGVLVFVGLFLFFKRRSKRNGPFYSMAQTSDTLDAGGSNHIDPLAELAHTARPAELAHTNSPSELPDLENRVQELDSRMIDRPGRAEA